jgi:hypothetical protein
VEREEQVEAERLLDPGQTGGDHEPKRENCKAHHRTIDSHLGDTYMI